MHFPFQYLIFVLNLPDCSEFTYKLENFAIFDKFFGAPFGFGSEIAMIAFNYVVFNLCKNCGKMCVKA